MANCSNCSAPLPGNSIRCEYCGTRNDVDLTGIHYHTTHEPEAPRPCPRCAVPLRTIDLSLKGKFLIERCDQCLGLFFDPGELEALLKESVTNVFTVNRAQLGQINNSMRSADYGVSYVKCPLCSQVMNRLNFGAKSGVIIDQCSEHGVWLDGGELRHLMEWMKAGGKLLVEERREQQKKEEELEKQRNPMRGQNPRGSASEYNDYDTTGTVLRFEEVNLLDLVCRAVAWVLR